eukprot:7055407-Lingulodinium_polyedra.AAC.1
MNGSFPGQMTWVYHSSIPPCVAASASSSSSQASATCWVDRGAKIWNSGCGPGHPAAMKCGSLGL